MEFTAESAPWWYVAFLAGVFSIIGATVSVLGVMVSDHLRRKFEARTAEDRLIRQLCADFARALSDVHYLYSDRNSSWPVPTDEVVSRARSAAYQAYTLTRLVGDQALFDDAKNFYDATIDALDVALAKGLGAGPTRDAGKEYRKHRDIYLNHVREVLGYRDKVTARG